MKINPSSPVYPMPPGTTIADITDIYHGKRLGIPIRLEIASQLMPHMFVCATDINACAKAALKGADALISEYNAGE